MVRYFFNQLFSILFRITYFITSLTSAEQTYDDDALHILFAIYFYGLCCRLTKITDSLTNRKKGYVWSSWHSGNKFADTFKIIFGRTNFNIEFHELWDKRKSYDIISLIFSYLHL